MMSLPKHLLILGCGYVGEKLARACLNGGVQVTATTRSRERATELQGIGITAISVDSPANLSTTVLAGVDAVLDSIPLCRDGQHMFAPQHQWLPALAEKLQHIQWAAYLSTTGVYGDANGGWVDETHVCQPTSARGRERLIAESLWQESGLPAEIFRLAGIYGPERNMLGRLKAGGYQAVSWQPPHWSSRIHVDDIVAALMAAMQRQRAGRIVNLADDEPLPHVEYVTELAGMIGAPSPVILSPEEGARELSPMALEFFRDNKRVSNRCLHRELLPELHYPSFRDAVETLIG
ncbi:NAD dependent epimerase/dehydratase family protein [Mariprofundus micogutta]|uniref:NAD dependent epimerase/dehydratase family protein n=1 Tax=Mariprofundus micogutta TaxID=1921010 RepID=A0A1L8CPP0_9PROT|nr:SDR family oxidoreductase [Mariprofundus micogutta]GAV20878.1 NAD dependent epimerase/dehydratase family protein [Mariprofundus micogutta]